MAASISPQAWFPTMNVRAIVFICHAHVETV